MFRPSPPQDRLVLPDRFTCLDVEVDLAAARAVRDGAPLPLEPRAFDLLVLLAANPGRVVEKQEIFDRLWSETIVSDNALSRVVAQLRRELGDLAESPRFIETVRTRGYRFLVTPTPRSSASDGGDPVVAPSRSKASPWMAAGRLGLVAALVVVAALVGIWRRGDSTATSLRPTSPTQLTIDPAFDGQPALSPDGSQVVFVSERRGPPELWARSLLGGGERPLAESSRPAVDPTFSPDGAWIAYSSPGGGIWRVAATGGESRRVAEFGSRPAFSPDGRRIAFQSQEQTAVFAGGWGASRDSTIWIADLESGAVRQLTTQGSTIGGHSAPLWTPEGGAIVFVANDYSGAGIWRVRIDDGAVEPITTSEGLLSDPILDHDGRHLLAVSLGRNRAWEVVRIALDGSRRGEREVVVPLAAPGTARLSLSRDGARLAYSVLASRSAIDWVPVNADGAPTGPIREEMAYDGLRLRYPTFLGADGSRLALARYRFGARGDLVVRNLANGETQEWSEMLYGFLAPLTDGRLADIRFPLEQASQIDPTSGAIGPLFSPERLAELPSGYRVSLLRVSSDLSRVAATLWDGSRHRIFVLEPGQPWPTEPAVDGDYSDWGVLSNDGRWVAFERAANHRLELWVKEIGGEAPLRLAADGLNWTGSFSPDASRIAYAKLLDGAWNLWTADVDAGASRPVTENRTFSAMLQDVRWSPTGDRIAWSRVETVGDIWTVDLTRPTD